MPQPDSCRVLDVPRRKRVETRCVQSTRGGADVRNIVIPALLVGGFVLGMSLGRWWALIGAVAVGIYFGIWSEVEVPGWYYGLASAFVTGASTTVGVLVRRKPVGRK